MHNIMIVSHKGIFLHIATRFPNSYHDVAILRHYLLYREWRQYFTPTDDYFKYMLGDPSYKGKDMFIMEVNMFA